MRGKQRALFGIYFRSFCTAVALSGMSFLVYFVRLFLVTHSGGWAMFSSQFVIIVFGPMYLLIAMLMGAAGALIGVGVMLLAGFLGF